MEQSNADDQSFKPPQALAAAIDHSWLWPHVRLQPDLAHIDRAYSIEHHIHSCGWNGLGRIRGCRPFGQGDCRLSPELWCSRSEEHTSELQSLMRISYAVFCLKKKKR